MPAATGGATAVSSSAISGGGRRRRRRRCSARRGDRGDRLRRASCRLQLAVVGWPETGDLLLRQRAAEIRHRPAGREQARGGGFRRDEEELTLSEGADRLVERRHVRTAGGGTEPFEHPGLVVLRLEAPDEPRPRIGHRLVVEVDRVLRREHEPEPGRAALLEDREDRLFRRRRRGRGHVAEHLVHVRQRAEVGRSLLAAHPRDELREDECDDELPLLLGEVGEVDDRAARLTVGGDEHRLRVERIALAPGREARRGDEGVERERQLRAVGQREELVDLEDAELPDRRRLDLADERAEVEVSAGAPGVLDQVRKEDVLAARERVGLDPDEREEARHRRLDLVAERLLLGLPRQTRHAERADDVQRHARGRARGVDRDVGRVPQLLETLGADAARRQAFAPHRRLPRGVVVHRDAGRLRFRLAHPRAKARRREVREHEREVRHVALGIEHECGDPRTEGLFDQHDREPCLAGSGHPDDDAVRRQVARADDDLVGAGLARLRVDRPSEVERPAVGHGRGV